jgi:flavodoxin
MNKFKEGKTLITYYSREGNNYVNGRIVNLPVGNTEVAAEMIRKITGGELFRINTIKKYPEDYTETTKVAQQELRDNARPELSEYLDSIDDYEVIILGYPNWWGTMPMPVFTFLEKYDFTDKIILPLCTHEGSGMGRSESDIKKLCPNSKVLKGLAIRGGNVNDSEKDIADWLKNINI